jgi:uncharacterized membrane protein
MKTFITQEDTTLIEDRLRRFEAATGCELLLVLARASDLYPAAPWRFGVLVGSALTFAASLFVDFHHGYLWPVAALLMTLAMVWVGHFDGPKKLALSDLETERETAEKAVESFHTLGTSRVSHKVTAMIMVSVLERKITVLVDEKLKSQITQPELDELVAIMRMHFREGRMGLGFIKSIESLEEKILKDFGGRVSDCDPGQLSDKIHFL